MLGLRRRGGVCPPDCWPNTSGGCSCDYVSSLRGASSGVGGLALAGAIAAGAIAFGRKKRRRRKGRKGLAGLKGPFGVLMTPRMRRAVASAKDGDCRGAIADLHDESRLAKRAGDPPPGGFGWNRAKKVVARLCGRR